MPLSGMSSEARCRSISRSARRHPYLEPVCVWNAANAADRRLPFVIDRSGGSEGTPEDPWFTSRESEPPLLSEDMSFCKAGRVPGGDAEPVADAEAQRFKWLLANSLRALCKRPARR